MGSKLIKYLILFLTIPFIGYSQIEIMNKDSLIALIPKKKDTALVQLYFKIGKQFEADKMNLAGFYYNKAYYLSDKVGYDEGILRYYSNYSYILNVSGKIDSSIILNKKAVSLSSKSNNIFNQGRALSNLAASYQWKDNLDSAIFYYQKAIDKFDKIKHQERLSIIYSNLIGLYQSNDDFAKALEFAKKAELISRNNHNQVALCKVLNNKGNVLVNLEKYNEANEVFIEAENLARKHKLSVELGNILSGRINIKISQHQYRQLIPLIDEAHKIYSEADDVVGKVITTRAKAYYYFNEKNFELAEKFALQSYQLSKEIEDDIQSEKNLSFLINVYAAQQNIDKYYELMDDHEKLRIMIHDAETNESIRKLEAEYQTEKKNLQIQNLQAQSKKRFWISIALALGIIGLGGIAYSQFKNYKTKKALLLAEQDKAVAEERLRIATDMHDDVGTGLSRIRYITNAVKTGETSKEDGLSKVTEISDDTITKMSEIIWALNESNQTLEELIYFIRSQASEMVENAKLNFEGILPEIIPDMSFGWMRNRNTYLLVKETINNAIKHAKAKTLSIQFEIKDQLIITIKDDGIGFDTNKKFNGNGLNNYKKRIEKLGGTYSIDSDENKGTTIVYQIPLV